MVSFRRTSRALSAATWPWRAQPSTCRLRLRAQPTAGWPPGRPAAAATIEDGVAREFRPDVWAKVADLSCELVVPAAPGLTLRRRTWQVAILPPNVEPSGR